MKLFTLLLLIFLVFLSCKAPFESEKELQFDTQKMSYKENLILGDTLRIPIHTMHNHPDIYYNCSEGDIIGDSLFVFTPKLHDVGHHDISITAASNGKKVRFLISIKVISLSFIPEKMIYEKEVPLFDTLTIPLFYNYNGDTQDLSFSTSAGTIVGDTLLRYIPSNPNIIHDTISIKIESSNGLVDSFSAPIIVKALHFNKSYTQIPHCSFIGDTITIPLNIENKGKLHYTIETNLGNIVHDTILQITPSEQEKGAQLITLTLQSSNSIYDTLSHPINILPTPTLKKGTKWDYLRVYTSTNTIYHDHHCDSTFLTISLKEIRKSPHLIATFSITSKSKSYTSHSMILDTIIEREYNQKIDITEPLSPIMEFFEYPWGFDLLSLLTISSHNSPYSYAFPESFSFPSIYARKEVSIDSIEHMSTSFWKYSNESKGYGIGFSSQIAPGIGLISMECYESEAGDYSKGLTCQLVSFNGEKVNVNSH